MAKSKFHQVVSEMLEDERRAYLDQNVFGRVGSLAFKETALVKLYRSLLMAALRRELTAAVHPKSFGLRANLGGICGYLHATDRMIVDSIYLSWDITDPLIIRVRVADTTINVSTQNITEEVKQIMHVNFGL